MPSIEELQLLNHVLEKKDWKAIDDADLTDEHFPVHKDAFEYVKRFKKEHGHLPTIETVLNKFDTFEIVEPENLDVVIHALKEDYLHRKFKPILVESAKKIGEKNTIEAILDLYNESSRFLKSIALSGQGYSYVGNAEKRLEDYLAIHGRSEDQIIGIPTGFRPLDLATNGIEYKEADAVDYFLVFAPTNMGKTLITSFLLQAGWMEAPREVNDYPAYFALEQKAKEIAYNWDNQIGKVSRLALTRGTMDAEMKDRYVEFIDRLKKKKRDMVIYDLDSNGGRPYTVEEIRRILEREGHNRFALDQLSKVRRKGTNSDLRQRLFDTSAEVREMILDTGIPGYIVAQANRDALKRVKRDITEEVDGSDIGEAFAILQDASKGISIVKINDTDFRVTVIKNRNNGTGQSFIVRYDFETGIVGVLNTGIGEHIF